jgi:hypothetical protein
MTIEIRHLREHRLTVAYEQRGETIAMAFAWAADGDQWNRKIGKLIAVNRLCSPKTVVRHRTVASIAPPVRPPKLNDPALDKENLIRYQAALDSWMINEWAEDLHGFPAR